MAEILTTHWTEYKKRWEFNGDAEEAVRFAGSMPGYAARTQYEFLLSRGLKPNHRFLDLGCGCLRGTIRLVDYLGDGRFFGADISMGLLKEALIECDRLKLSKVPFLQLIDDFDLAKMFSEKFDYIFSFGLIPYLHPDDIPGLFKGIASVMAPGGKLALTLYPLDEKSQEDVRFDPYLTWYKVSWLAEQAAKAGINLSEPKERFANRIPSKGPPILKVVNSNLPEWVLEGTNA